MDLSLSSLLSSELSSRAGVPCCPAAALPLLQYADYREMA